MERMDLKQVARRWQQRWAAERLFATTEPGTSKKPPYYCLEMFPYPSGYLHMGHVRNYSLGDVKARFERMRGKNVLYPMGYDSFGLPAENAAIKHKVDPHDWTEKNIAGIKAQQQLMGISYDWSREIATSRADYYRWNQLLFLKLLEKGLAYRKGGLVNWCPDCETVLANEQVVDGNCWRHTETAVEKKSFEQWYLKITDYAEELLADLDTLDHWPERVKTMQRNWIGKSHGTTITFRIKELDKQISTFTTRPDTAYGITYLVIAAEHPLVEELIADEPAERQEAVRAFCRKVQQQSIIERTAEGKEKNGIFTGKHAINPLTGEAVQLWVADYVLADYGTGIVMAVPTHDQRDFEFAKKYQLPLRLVISPDAYELDATKMSRAYIEDGTLVNSGEFDGMNNRDAIGAITEKLEALKAGEATVNYKLRDWLISRQRYWGTPIPIIYCDACGQVPVPEEQIPVELPRDVDFSKGGNPLATASSFIETDCPRCGKPARRETDTMDTFVDSSWYFLRFCDPHNNDAPFSKQAAETFMPVNQYIGGIEHAVLHLLYARFITKALRDLNLISVDEPFARLLTLGMVTKDGAKMSKSLGNTVDPGAIIDRFGPDTARLFILFTAHPEKELEWSDRGVEATYRFLHRLIALTEEIDATDAPTKRDALIASKLHSTIARVTDEIERFRYNTAIQHLMELTHELGRYKEGTVNGPLYNEALDTLLLLFTPFIPHLCEELWERRGHDGFISTATWPVADERRIDKALEHRFAALDSLRSDIKTVLELAKVEAPSTIKLITAPQWKHDLFAALKQKLTQTNDPKALIGALMPRFKEHGQEVTKLLPAVLKDRSKLPLYETSEAEEERHLTAFTEELAAEFGCTVTIERGSASREQKARAALPGKPAIIVTA